MLQNSYPRAIVRWLHIIFAIPIAGYVYSPFENIPDYAPLTRYFFFPALVLLGLRMWKRAPRAADL